MLSSRERASLRITVQILDNSNVRRTRRRDLGPWNPETEVQIEAQRVKREISKKEVASRDYSLKCSEKQLKPATHGDDWGPRRPPLRDAAMLGLMLGLALGLGSELMIADGSDCGGLSPLVRESNQPAALLETGQLRTQSCCWLHLAAPTGTQIYRRYSNSSTSNESGLSHKVQACRDYSLPHQNVLLVCWKRLAQIQRLFPQGEYH